MDIFDFVLKTDEILEKSKNIRHEQLYLEIDVTKITTDSLFGERELMDWIRLLNNNLGKLKVSHLFASCYFEKGIPDDDWYKMEEGTIKFLPNLDEAQRINKFWFGFYIDSAYYFLFNSWDTLIHLINIYYGFEIKDKPSFNKDVKNKLRKINKDLYDFFEACEKNEAFIKGKKIRNDTSHNYSPRYIGSLIKRIKEVKEGVPYNVTKFGCLPEYITTRDLNETIEKVMEIMGTVLQRIKKEFTNCDKKGVR